MQAKHNKTVIISDYSYEFSRRLNVIVNDSEQTKLFVITELHFKQFKRFMN